MRNRMWKMIGCGVLALAAVILLVFISDKLQHSEDGMETDDAAVSIASGTDAAEPFTIETEDGTVYEYKGGEYADDIQVQAAGGQVIRDGEMTIEEANSLSEEELASYLSQVEVPDWVYDLSGLSEEMAQEDPWYYTKIYMSINGDIFISGFGNPYCDERSDRLEAIENAEDSAGTEAVQCVNRIVYLTSDFAVCSGMNEAAFSFGLYTEDTCHVYLNPRSLLDGHIVAFAFMSGTTGEITAVYDEADVGDIHYGKNKGENSLVLVGTSYDQLAAGTDVIWYGNTPGTVYVRAIDMESYKILASFVIEVGVADDSGSFGITDVRSNSIYGISNETIADAIRTTEACFYTSDPALTMNGSYMVGNRATTQVTDEQYCAWQEDYVLETLPRMFNGVVLDIDTGYAWHRNHYSFGDVYAVTVNTDFGARTVYFRTTNSVSSGEQTVISLSPVAYDFILPTTQDAYRAQYISD